MTTDPRLHNLELLTLAAMRARRRQQIPDWQTTEGLAALLQAAKALPPHEPVDLSEVDTTTGLGRMLAEARLAQKERDDGT